MAAVQPDAGLALSWPEKHQVNGGDRVTGIQTLGRLAALLGRTEQALDHFAQAVTVNARLGARPFVASPGWTGPTP